MMKARHLTVFAILQLFLLLVGCASNQPAISKAAVATAHPLATQAGFRALDQGGNAFDAAVAAAAVLAVVEPYSAGMGGGGFWTLQDKNGSAIVIDAREQAPEQAHRDMYLDTNGDLLPGKPSTNGPLAAAIPGQAAAFAHISKHYGIRPLSANLTDAIRIAERGFRVDKKYQQLAHYRQNVLNQYPASADLFLQNGQIPSDGYIVKQAALANTLSQLARYGHKGFYEGDIAKQLVADIRAAGGIWTTTDLSQYRIVERAPIIFDYEDATIITTPPPSSGGIALQQMLKILERFDTSEMDRVEKVHLITEIMRRAYRDRAEWLGDPDYVNVPYDQLTATSYLYTLAKGIDLTMATPSSQLTPARVDDSGTHTTHLSVLDKWGNKVSATLSINLPFGSAFTSQSTGVLLNNEMDDFSIKPGTPNTYGLVGNEQNAIAPGKRPLSSMTPSIIETTDSSAIIGTPGGSRIITMVLLGILDYMEGKPVNQWVQTPRYHHQYLPDVIQHEPDTFSETEKQALVERGHQLKDVKRQYGNMQAIYRNRSTGEVEAASDPRGVGQAIVR